jgi:hypothetical protein
VFYGSNPYRKDNPRWAIGNAMETPKAAVASYRLLPPAGRWWNQPATGLGSGLAASLADRARNASGICVAWLIGIPRRAGARVHATNDAEARWWHWQVTESYGGLVRQYRDARFQALPGDPALRRDGTGDGLASPDTTRPGCARPGDR